LSWNPNTPDSLPADIARALALTSAARGPIGERLHFVHEVGSTNDEAARLAERGAGEGTVVMALAQTSGRGRFGRMWFSPPGAGLYVSVVCRNRHAAPYLSLAGGVAVAEGIRRSTGLPVEIKWPNDIGVAAGSSRWRKVAGVLAEGSTSAEGLQHVVLGFGINLRPAAYPPEIGDRATSLEAELGRAVEAGPVLAETLAALNEQLATLATGLSAELLARWRALAPSAVGTLVEWDTPAGVRHGRTAGIDDAGALLVRVDGATERIISGTLRWI
jgi:BirA family biotin operon repressor/biotin-[acetyl-CoA-carboxylase] ligase